MSGIDDLTRFCCTFNPAWIGNDAWFSQAEFRSGAWYSYNPVSGVYDAPDNYSEYPHPSSGQGGTINSVYPSDVDGVFGGRGFRVFSYEPTLTPVRSMSYWWVEERTSNFAPSGLLALFGNDYTIDFWIKVNPGASGKQPIMGNASTWEIYYEDGVIHQQQGLYHHVSCACDLTGSFHHVEFNRSLGISRILIDGVLQTLIADLWNPQGYNLVNFFIGCTYYDFRNVDYVIDEVRFSTGIARHMADFDVMTEEYSRTSWKSGIYLFIQETGTNDIYSGYYDSANPVPVELPVTDISVANNTLTKVGHGLSNTNLVYVYGSSIIPGGLESNRAYYVVNVSGDTFKLSLTSGGTAIDITSQGSGSLALIKSTALVTINTDTAFYEAKQVTGTIYSSIGLVDVRSPINGEISFGLFGLLSFEYPLEATVPAITDGKIGILGHFEFQLEIAPDVTVPSITNGSLQINSPLDLEGGVYGLTIPSVQDAEILLEGPMAITVVLDTDAIPIGDVDPGVIYDLIENAIELPAELLSVISLEGEAQFVPTFTFRFVNAIELDITFSFVNGLNFDYESEFTFRNKVTEQIEILVRIRNEMLSYNEVVKQFTSFNRLLPDPGSPSPPVGEQYSVFYFSKSHGA